VPGVTTPDSRGWPARLWLVRHGQSEGNVADDEAKRSGAATVAVGRRDPDVPLSPVGRHQAEALGVRWHDAPPEDRPEAVVASPYARAYETAAIAVAAARSDIAIRRDERLRERDLGLFDGLTAVGIRERYPDEAKRRGALGKFYYRPPYGESWADVALRVRSFVADLREEFTGMRVALVSHQAVLFVCRYVLESLTEQEILAIDRQHRFANGGVTTYVADGVRLRLVEHDATGHLDAHGAPATVGEDSHVDA
jgi:broad specificity phosphatase PhoE